MKKWILSGTSSRGPSIKSLVSFGLTGWRTDWALLVLEPIILSHSSTNTPKLVLEGSQVKG